jgi:hypothetical protein
MAKMRNGFFELSDLLQRYRRNLLFVGVLCILHFTKQIGGSELKIFDVKFPDHLINIGLPVCLAWFAINYSYHLYAEVTQWKSEALVLKDGVPLDTLSVYIAYASPKQATIRTTLSDGPLIEPSPTATDEQIQHATKFGMQGVIERAVEDVKRIVNTDKERVDRFNNAMKRYHWSNIFRWYALDIGAPAVLTVIAFAFAFGLIEIH